MPKFADIPAWSVALAIAVMGGIGTLYAQGERTKATIESLSKHEDLDNRRIGAQWKAIQDINENLAEQKEMNGRIDERTKDMKDDLKILLREIRNNRP